MDNKKYIFTKNISIVHRHQQILINHYLKPYGIGSGQYVFLAKIYENPGINQKSLTKLVKIDKATTTKALKKLEEEKYIFRVQDKQDLRYYSLYLTPKGEEFIPILFNMLDNIKDVLTKDISPSEYEIMIRCLDLIIKNVNKSIDDLKLHDI